MIVRLSELDPDKLTGLYEALAGDRDVAGRVIVNPDGHVCGRDRFYDPATDMRGTIYLEGGRAQKFLTKLQSDPATRTKYKLVEGVELELAIYVPDDDIYSDLRAQVTAARK